MKLHINITCIILCLLIFIMPSKCNADVNDQDVAEVLEKLHPLPKVHYYAAMNKRYLDEYGNKVLYEVARITHSAGVSGEWATEKQVDNCVYTCARVNKTNPKIKASLSISYSPWHRKFKKDLPVTNRGESYLEEITYFEYRMNLVKKWIMQANIKYGSDIKVTMLKFDSERFYEKPGDEEWNEAFRQCLDIIQTKAQEIFPEAKIQWYGRGIWRPDGFTWRKTPYFTGKEIKSPLSCSLYMVPEIEDMREIYRRTCKLADSLDINNVTPYVALGCGYRRGIKKSLTWDAEWDYDLIYSYLLGAELNIKAYSKLPDIYADYNRAEYIILYRPSFDTNKYCLKHFVAYVNGATGIKSEN